LQVITKHKVLQRVNALFLYIYKLTTVFLLVERYGLTSQLRRAVLSVPTNIAEGSKRVSNQDYARFLNMAEASLAETEYLLPVSRDLEYATPAAVNACFSDVAELASMLHGLRKKVEAK